MHTEGEPTSSATAAWELCSDGFCVIDGEGHLLKDTCASSNLRIDVGVLKDGTGHLGTDKSLCNKIGVCTEGETTFSATAKLEHCLLNCDGTGVIDSEEHLLKDTYTSGILGTEVGV